MSPIHQNLAYGKWQGLTFCEQMGNIGSEFHRMFLWYQKKETKNMQHAAHRVLELLDFTIDDKRWKNHLSELLRLREVICDIYLNTHWYDISLTALENYFLSFALAIKR